MTKRNVLLDNYMDDILNDIIREWSIIREQSTKEKGGNQAFVYAPRQHRQNSKTFNPIAIPKIKRVIFNDPATIVIFEDGSKTIAKSEKHDPYDEEIGMAICIAKRVLGNANYRKIMDKYVYNRTSDIEEDNCKECKHYSTCSPSKRSL